MNLFLCISMLKRTKPMNRTSIGGFGKAKSRLKTSRLLRKPSNVSLSGKPRKRRQKSDLAKAKETLWNLCREIVKARGGYKCYTCGKIKRKKGALHTGHYIASSLCSVELRYELGNLARQCYACNINRSGNTLRFQKYLIRDHGQEFVDELWTRNEATKGKTYPLQWFLDKTKEYQSILDSVDN